MLRGHVLLRQAVTASTATPLLLARSTALSRTPLTSPSALALALALARHGGTFLTRPNRLLGVGAAVERKRSTRKGLPKKVVTSASKRKERQPIADNEHDTEPVSDADSQPSTAKPVFPEPVILPPRLSRASTKHHHDLGTYLHDVKTRGLDLTSSVVRGTRYEYQVQESLRPWLFDLIRVGRAGDEGIDLIGYWYLPFFDDLSPTKVIVQCKDSPPSPKMIRELAGSYPGAAAGWDANTTLSFLVSSTPMTKATLSALERCPQPMGFIQITSRGRLRRIVWNNAADAAGLKNLSVTPRYSTGTGADRIHGGEVKQTACLYWKGEPLGTGKMILALATEI